MIQSAYTGRQTTVVIEKKIPLVASAPMLTERLLWPNANSSLQTKMTFTKLVILPKKDFFQSSVD